MRGRGSRMGTFAVVVLVLALAGGVWWWLNADDGSGADLLSVTSDVERLDGASRAREFVPASEHRGMTEGDGVSVNDAGRARLEMSGCVLDVFRATTLHVEGVPSLSAPVCLTQMTHGTIYGKVTTRTVVGTDWAVVTASGTEFLVFVDERIGLLWVIVADGFVEVEAEGVTVALTAGEQAWVWRDDPPVGPVPALRSEVPDVDRFPPLDQLTNGVIPDDELLEPDDDDGGEPEPVGLDLRQSTDEVVVPECAGDRQVEVFAIVSGPDDVVAEVRTASIAYGWNGETVDVFAMERVDDRTFRAVVQPNYQYDPADPDGRTTLVFTVTLRGENRAPLAERSGETALQYCIG
ncbi:MAG: hypothetical protein LPK92_05910 [Actinomycetes bacterium]|nr:hypothetical protein [Actinomycetes bacterium]